MLRDCAGPESWSRARSRWRASTDAREARYSADNVECIDLNLIPADLPFGKTSAIAGEAAYRYVERAVRIVEQGGAQAICTAPLSKEALHAAGHNIPATPNCWRRSPTRPKSR